VEANKQRSAARTDFKLTVTLELKTLVKRSTPSNHLYQPGQKSLLKMWIHLLQLVKYVVQKQLLLA